MIGSGGETQALFWQETSIVTLRGWGSGSQGRLPDISVAHLPFPRCATCKVKAITRTLLETVKSYPLWKVWNSTSSMIKSTVLLTAINKIFMYAICVWLEETGNTVLVRFIFTFLAVDFLGAQLKCLMLSPQGGGKRYSLYFRITSYKGWALTTSQAPS